MEFPLNRPARLAVFASGSGSNLAALLTAFPKGHALAEVALVLSNKKDAFALERAKAQNIPALAHPFPSRKRDPRGEARARFEAFANTHLDAHDIDLICLAGFMRLFSGEFNERWHARILNIHPSLLPDFKGLHPQRQALTAGVSEAGCSVHFVETGVDTGPVILQRRVPVLPDDTEASLSERILAQEHIAYPAAVEKVLRGEIRYREVVDKAASPGEAKTEVNA